MDITLNKTKSFSNQFINSETVNYTIAFSFSFFILLAVKQLFKTFFGVGVSISCTIGFVFAEIVLFLIEKFFVYKKNASSTIIRQAIFAVLNALIHFGIYKLAISVLCSKFNLYNYTVWLILFVFFFIINYPISRILIFGCDKSPNNMNGGKIYTKFFNNRFIVLSMLISLIGMGFMFIIYTRCDFHSIMYLYRKAY